MAAESSPTVRGRLLAIELRRRRERAGLNQAAAARQLGWAESKVSRIESTRRQPSLTDVERALELYGATDADRLKLLDIARDARVRGWWQQYDDAFTGDYVGLEDGASEIDVWAPQMVPGLLQTEDYAREVIRESRVDASDLEIQRRVQARMARRALLSRPNPPHLSVVLDEAVLRRVIGSPDTMRDQLYELGAKARRPNLTLQVLPFSAGAHAGLEGPLLILKYAEDADLDIGYVEHPGGPVYLEAASEVKRFKLRLDRLRDKALTPEKSAALIAALIKE